MRTGAGRRRLLWLSIALAVIPVGLAARAMRGDTDASVFTAFITDYLGDTLWAVMFFFLLAASLPRWRTSVLAAMTLLPTLGIEASQRYRGEPLATLRGFAPTRFLLGTNFLWSDVVCLIVGTLLASAVHLILKRVVTDKREEPGLSAREAMDQRSSR